MLDSRRMCVLVTLVLLPACSAGASPPSADAGASADGSAKDGSAKDGSAGDGGATCPTYGASDKACTTAADCTTVARGCYCGAQPVIGISKAIAAAAQACETTAANQCALGCANFPGQVAEDGQGTQDGGTIAVLCDSSVCHTVVQ